MPIKGKKPDSSKKNISQPGFFERIGKNLDCAVLWVKERFGKVRSTYRSVNGDYVKTIRKKKIFRILPPSLLVLLLFFVMVPFFVVQILSDDTIVLEDGRYGIVTLDNGRHATSFVPTSELTGGEIRQKLYVREGWSDVSDIGILFGTLARTNHADYEFILTEDGEPIYSQVFSAAILEDCAYHRFRFEEPLDLDPEKDYIFSVRAVNTSDQNAIVLFQNTSTGDIIYSVSAWSRFHILNMIASIAFLILFCTINVLVNCGKIKNEFSFLACMLGYIVPLVFIYPAYTVPDEPYHFISALRLADYDLAKSPSENLSNMNHDLPANSDCIAAYFLNTGTPEKITPDTLLSCLSSEPNKTANYVEAASTSRILAYIPAALGIKVGNLISNSPMVIFYCGRIFNLITVSIIIVFAISLLKRHRLILLSIIFIPMFLQQAISYSYDGILNSLCLLMIAYGIRFLTTDAKVQKHDVVIMAIALAFIGLIKLPYVVVAAPLIFVNPRKFSSHKWVKWLVGLGLLLAMTVPYAIDGKILTLGSNGDSVTALENPETDQQGYPIETLLQPFSVAKIFLLTIYGKGVFYINSLIGYFGWFYFSLGPILIIIYIIFLIIMVLADNEKELGRGVRIWMFFIAATLSLSFLLVMYLEWTPVSSPLIEGVQGRYFLPAVPLLSFALIPKKQKIKIPKEAVYAFLNLFTLCFIITLLLGFY